MTIVADPIVLRDEEELTSRYLLKWLAILWGPEEKPVRNCDLRSFLASVAVITMA